MRVNLTPGEVSPLLPAGDHAGTGRADRRRAGGRGTL